MVESQPSKLLVAGPIPVSRSIFSAPCGSPPLIALSKTQRYVSVADTLKFTCSVQES